MIYIYTEKTSSSFLFNLYTDTVSLPLSVLTVYFYVKEKIPRVRSQQYLPFEVGNKLYRPKKTVSWSLASSHLGTNICSMSAQFQGIIILYRNSLHPFDFMAQLGAGRNYTPITSSAELDAASNSAPSYLWPVFHSAFLSLHLWWFGWLIGEIFFKQICSYWFILLL